MFLLVDIVFATKVFLTDPLTLKNIVVAGVALFCAVETQNLLLTVIPVDFRIAWFVWQVVAKTPV